MTLVRFRAFVHFLHVAKKQQSEMCTEFELLGRVKAACACMCFRKGVLHCHVKAN